jgi:RNA polymerase sigma-70 factor, ECF subfamily
MKSFLARAVVNIARRGESRGHRFAWWGRWFPPATTVDPDRFQGEGDPYPDHWKKFPQPWPAIPPSEQLAVRLEAALAELPEPWFFLTGRHGSWSFVMSKACPPSRLPTRSG